MKAVREVGVWKIIRFFLFTLFLAGFNVLLFPTLRWLALRFAGATIGPDSIIHGIHFFNAYRGGFKGLQIGQRCFIGDECLLDLADAIILEDDVTLSERVTVLTHTNVGYSNHPLQSYFPAFSMPVCFKPGSFVGANATILPGVTIGEGAFVAAGSVIVDDVPGWTLVGGVPARVIRQIKKN